MKLIKLTDQPFFINIISSLIESFTKIA